MSQASSSMCRSLRIRQDCIQSIQLALKHHGFASQQALASDRGISLSTISKFIRGKQVDSGICIELCHLLGFEVKDVTEPGYGSVESSVTCISPQPIEQPRPKTSNWEQFSEFIEISHFYGRTEELEILQRWVMQENCCLIGITGIKEIGKSALLLKFAQTLQGKFDRLIWRSLSTPPTLEALLADLMGSLTGQSPLNLPATTEALIRMFITLLRDHRYFVVLDGFDALFRPEGYASCYQDEHQSYESLLKAIAESTHQSCVILTSRVQPKELALFSGRNTPVRTLQLTGLTPSEGKEIFNLKGCFGSDEQHWQEVFDRYGGHPVALRIVAAGIQEMFGGNILGLIVFLRKDQLVFKDIADFWHQCFQQLDPIEQAVICCIVQNDSFSLDMLAVADYLCNYPTQDLFEAVRSLFRRGLIELKEQTLVLHPSFAYYVDKNQSAESLQQSPQLLPVELNR